MSGAQDEIPPPAIRGEFLNVWHSSDLLVFTVRSHQIVDTLLGEAIVEILPNADGIEIGRLSFLLKVDLCVAFRAVSRELRGAFAVFNRVRNRFAHEFHARLASEDVRDLYNSIAPEARKGFGIEALTEDEAIFRKCVSLLYLTSEFAVERLRDGKAENAEWHAIADSSFLPESEWPPEVMEKHKNREQRISEVVREARRKRRQDGKI